MKKYLILALAVLALLGTISYQHQRIATLTGDNERLTATQGALLDSVRHYRTTDGLQAAQTREERLKVADLKTYRAEDWKLAQSLKTRGRDIAGLTSVTTMARDTVLEVLRDTVIVREQVPVQAKAIAVDRRWWSLRGTLQGDTLDAELVTRSSLRIVETVKYKRFLGFLWKTNKVEDRKVDVVSLNPNERIDSVEFITVEK